MCLNDVVEGICIEELDFEQYAMYTTEGPALYQPHESQTPEASLFAVKYGDVVDGLIYRIANRRP